MGKIKHNKEQQLLAERPLPGIGAFYPSMLQHTEHTGERLLWAICDGKLITVDEYCEQGVKHNEDNYYKIGDGQYIGSQDALIKTMLSSDLEAFLKERPWHRARILGTK